MTLEVRVQMQPHQPKPSWKYSSCLINLSLSMPQGGHPGYFRSIPMWCVAVSQGIYFKKFTMVDFRISTSSSTAEISTHSFGECRFPPLGPINTVGTPEACKIAASVHAFHPWSEISLPMTSCVALLRAANNGSLPLPTNGSR